MTDYADWQTPNAHATQIAATGVPLLTLPTLLLQQTFDPAAGVTQSSASLAITQPGYEIIVQSSFSVAPTSPFIRVTIGWNDGTSLDPVNADTFIAPASTTPGAFRVQGNGPTKGNAAVISVTNLDGLQVATVQVMFLQHSRILASDDWTYDNAANAGLTVTGFTLPKMPADQSCLGVLDNVTIAAAGSSAWLFGICAGLATVSYEIGSGAASTLSLRIRPKPDTEYSGHNILYSAVSAPPNFQIAGARAPLGVILANSATTSLTMSLAIFKAVALT